jgi:hypothetical protein
VSTIPLGGLRLVVDWRVALGVVAALAATYGASRIAIPAWFIAPAALLILLPVSLRRATWQR